MALDLLLDENGDLALSPSHDLAAADGEALQRQRIMLRLRTIRESWRIDPSLGSRLQELLNSNVEEAQAQIEQYVREALAPMSDISIIQIEAVPLQDGVTTNRGIKVSVSFNSTGDIVEDVFADDPQFSTAEVGLKSLGTEA